jgi:hypothetical protein
MNIINKMISGSASAPGVRPPSREVADGVRQQTEQEVGEESEQGPLPILTAAGTSVEGRVLFETPLDGIHQTDPVVRQFERLRGLSRAGGVGLVAHGGLLLQSMVLDTCLTRARRPTLANKASAADISKAR